MFQNLKSSVPVTEEIMCVNMTSISGPVLHSFGQRLEKKNCGAVKEPTLGYSQSEIKHYSDANIQTFKTLSSP